MGYVQPQIHELKAAYLNTKAAYENAEPLLAFTESEEYAQLLREADAGDDQMLSG